MTNHALLILTLLSEPEAPSGCAKDTDCKGDRICDASSRVCVDPVAPEVATPPAPAITPPKREYRFKTETYTERPYVSGGALLLTFGALGVGGGTALSILSKQRFDDTAENIDVAPCYLADCDQPVAELVDAGQRLKRAQIGAGILVSSGVVLFVTGAVLLSIEKTYTRRVRVASNGFVVTF